MRLSRWTLVITFLVILAGSAPYASGLPVGPGPLRELQGQSEVEGQSVDPEQDPEQDPDQEPGARDEVADVDAIDPATLPAINIATTDEQEVALRLVEEILVEQRMLLAGQNFVYQAGGRRDPFRSLLAVRRREIEAPELRPPGVPGFLISEIQLAATASFQGRWQAMIVGLDQRSYFVEVGALLYDGRVVEISGDEVIFEQDVEDLLGARSTRRVSKRLATGNQEY